MSGVGVGSPIGSIRAIEIDIQRDEYFLMGRTAYPRTLDDEALEKLTGPVFESFWRLEKEIIQLQSVTLDPTMCADELAVLAEWGVKAYNGFFENQAARARLANLFKHYAPDPAPTFASGTVPFPWEVLFDGDLDKPGSNGFWGIRHAVARNLKVGSDTAIELVQDPRASMLFCLYHKLQHARDQERPRVQEMIGLAERGSSFRLLSRACWVDGLKGRPPGGSALIKYLVSTHAQYNMLHFACHCREGKISDDALLLSLIDEAAGGNAGQIEELQLESNDFDIVSADFPRQPLVFLNACESSGVARGELRRTYNLPAKFIARNAGAVVATACPVPDIFAAEFALRFYLYFMGGEEVVGGQKKSHPPLPIGEALRRTRHYFLETHHNPLALAYGLYSPAHYQLARAPREGASPI